MSDYELIDSGNERKLERFGKVVLSRPSSTAYWPVQNPSVWRQADATFSRKEGLQWEMSHPLPKRWKISLSGLKMWLKATDFGHLGIFPEQQANWKWIRESVQKAVKQGREVSVLNLFAYSGGSTLAAAQGGASVCHLDASKGMVDWARENIELNRLEKAPIRWIVDDAMKFIERERKRGRKYDAIILDPPSFGRGNRGEIFKIERDAIPLLQGCRSILSESPLFFLFSCHTPGFTPVVMKQLLSHTMRGLKGKKLEGTIESGEMCLEGHKKGGFHVPSGTFARWLDGKSS